MKKKQRCGIMCTANSTANTTLQRVLLLHLRGKMSGELLRRAGVTEMYALDWQHDCFRFSTDEDIPYWLHWYDLKREVMVYFPCYYPDGDYHFFISTDLSAGFLGHPWRHELCVFGESLIQAFDEHKQELDLEEVQP